MRVGGTDHITADVRLIAATNKDLEKCLAEGTFRVDLYYRLNVVAIRLPALRERKDDILPLAQFFLKRSNEKMGKNIFEIPEDVLEVLLEYDWPGNVRELENVIERAVVLVAEGTMIQRSHLPDKLLEAHIGGGTPLRGISYREAKQQAVDSFNKEFLERLLQMSQGNISQAAKLAQMDGANFRRLMRKCGVRVEEHRQKWPCQ